jgi:hypothetical protein
MATKPQEHLRFKYGRKSRLIEDRHARLAAHLGLLAPGSDRGIQLTAWIESRLNKGHAERTPVDVSNIFDPLSAATIGVDLARLLWVGCGVQSHRSK